MDDNGEFTSFSASNSRFSKYSLFSIKFTKVDNISPSKPLIEYAEEKSNKPRKKTESILNQSDMILQVIEKLNGKFPMNPKNELALRSSCLILVAEFMSQFNMENLDIGLDGLIDGDKNLNTSYKVEAFRREFTLNKEIYSKPKF